MDWRKIILATCIGSLSISSVLVAPTVSSVEQPLSQRSTQQLQKQARLITVKVLSKDFLGSGILIYRQGSVYTVLTNAHVLRSGKAPYQIQAYDGKVYAATSQSMSDRGNDLAQLKFRSDRTKYTVASLDFHSSLTKGNKVFAAGFPFDEEGDRDIGFVFRSGEVSLVVAIAKSSMKNKFVITNLLLM